MQWEGGGGGIYGRAQISVTNVHALTLLALRGGGGDHFLEEKTLAVYYERLRKNLVAVFIPNEVFSNTCIRVPGAEIPEKRSREWPNLPGKHTCRRDTMIAGLRER